MDINKLDTEGKRALIDIFIDAYLPPPDPFNAKASGDDYRFAGGLSNVLLGNGKKGAFIPMIRYARALRKVSNLKDWEIYKLAIADKLIDQLFEELKPLEKFNCILKCCSLAFIFQNPTTKTILKIADIQED